MKMSMRLSAAVLCVVAITSLNGWSQTSFSTSGQGGFWGPGLCENMHQWVDDIVPQTTIVTTSDEVRVRQFILQSSFTIGRITSQVGAGAFAGRTFNFGVYSASGNLLLDSGPFDGSITTVQTLSITPVTLPAGTYYFAQSASHWAISVMGVAGSAPNLVVADAIANATTPRIAIAANSASSGVLPSTLGGPTAENISTAAGTGVPFFEP